MQKKTILIVEDEKPLLNAVSAKLQKSGFGVVTSRTVAQALSCMKEISNIDAIWLDHYLLGKGTGLDFVVEIKNNEHWKHIPIFVVSNTATPEKVHSYIEFGVKKYYTKADFRLEQIIADMKDVLK